MNEHSVDQNTSTRTRKILVAKSTRKQLVLHDHRDTGSVTVTVDQITRADVAGRDGDPISFLDHVTLPSATDKSPELYHLVCHIRTSREGFAKNPENRDNSIPLFPERMTGKKVIALQATTQDSLTGKGEVLEVLENSYVWLPMNDRSAYRKISDWLPEFLTLTFEQAKELAGFTSRTQATQFEAEFSHFLNIIFPGCIEYRLAFHLLCEAAKVVEEENTKRKAKGEQTSNTAELSGIIIHAPHDLGEWLAPFGENLTAAAIPKVAGMIGSDPVKTAAGKVLRTVNENGELSQAITDFMKAAESQNP